ncbi:MAG: hypothetical protein IIC59_14430, partial [Proteobacteria bacterium]|nr:hypothetical protein [Pseudomonadota bacterium]
MQLQPAEVAACRDVVEGARRFQLLGRRLLRSYAVVELEHSGNADALVRHHGLVFELAMHWLEKIELNRALSRHAHPMPEDEASEPTVDPRLGDPRRFEERPFVVDLSRARCRGD